MRYFGTDLGPFPCSTFRCKGVARIQIPQRTPHRCRQLLRIAVRAHHHQRRPTRWRLQDWEEHRRAWIFGDVPILSVFHNTDNLYARSILYFVIPARCVWYAAKDFAGEFLVNHRHARRLFVIVPRETPAGEQCGHWAGLGHGGDGECASPIFSDRLRFTGGTRICPRLPAASRAAHPCINVLQKKIQGSNRNNDVGFESGLRFSLRVARQARVSRRMP